MNGMASMKMVDVPWVNAIAFTGPYLSAILPLNRDASPMEMLHTASRGPVIESGIPYFRYSQVGTRGMTSPAPRPIRLLKRENFSIRRMCGPLIRDNPFVPALSSWRSPSCLPEGGAA